MMGFLERLSAVAQQSAPRVHPLVESIYAAANAEEHLAPGARFESASQPVEGGFSARRTSVSPPSPESNAAAHAPVAPRAGARPIHPNSHRREDALEPVLPMRESRPAHKAISPPASANISWDSNAVDAGPLVASQPDPAREPQPPEQLVHGLGYLPRIMERLVGEAAPPSHDHAPSAKPSSQPYRPLRPGDAEAQAIKASDPGRQPQTAQPARHSGAQADDIQIHIGRIEVLAVPQAAPRPATIAARKGQSLDEYLSRRNGRAG
jgi:hypothetical protein